MKLDEKLKIARQRNPRWVIPKHPFIKDIIINIKNMKYPKALGSSVDPQKLSLTVKGILVGLIPFIIIIAKGFNVDLNNDELMSVIDGIVSLIVNIGAIVSVAVTVYGGIRKIINKFKK